MYSKLARSLLLLAFVGLAAGAQEAENEVTDEVVRAVEIEAMEPGVSTAEADQVGTEEIDPTVPTVVLAQDIRRRQSSNGVMDEIDLGRTEITGNQELPKVLYIIPWKNSDLGDLVGRPVNTLLDEVLAPVDPEVFRRQLDYYDTLYGESQEE
jgi:hypothetical protein